MKQIVGSSISLELIRDFVFDYVKCMTISSFADKFLICGCGDNSVKQYDLQTGKVMQHVKFSSISRN